MGLADADGADAVAGAAGAKAEAGAAGAGEETAVAGCVVGGDDDGEANCCVAICAADVRTKAMAAVRRQPNAAADAVAIACRRPATGVRKGTVAEAPVRCWRRSNGCQLLSRSSGRQRCRRRKPN